MLSPAGKVNAVKVEDEADRGSLFAEEAEDK